MKTLTCQNPFCKKIFFRKAYKRFCSDKCQREDKKLSTDKKYDVDKDLPKVGQVIE